MSNDTAPVSTAFEPGAPGAAGSVPLCVPEIRGNEWNYIKRCLDTNFVSSVGEYVSRFEDQLAAYVGTKHAVATVNGTAAIHIALLVAGVEPDDEVLVSTLTFIAPVNAIRYAGAWPVFVDAEPQYLQMDVSRAVAFLEEGCVWDGRELRNRATGRRVRAVLPVHILGHPVDIDPLIAAARRFGLPVIEDATESLGARYRNRNVGTLGDIACFSFNGNKLITTGGGGMIVTDRAEWAKRAKYLTTQAKDDPIEFVHGAVGFNYRLTNIQAALGCAQLEKIQEYADAKRRIAGRYAAAFRRVRGLRLVDEAPWAFSTYWLSTLIVDRDAAGIDSRELLRALERRNVQSRPLWQPAHKSPAHRQAAAAECPVAEHLNDTALCIPSSVGLDEAQQQLVIDTILGAVRH